MHQRTFWLVAFIWIASFSASRASMDDDAASAGLNMLRSFVTFCDGSAVFSTRGNVYQHQRWEVKDPQYTISSEAISPADKLNGIEWKGYFDLLGIAIRDRLIDGITHTRASQDDLTWVDQTGKTIIRIPIRKINGKWEIDSASIIAAHQPILPSCDFEK